MLALKTLKGAGWSVAARLISRVIDFAVLIILARLILPSDFGLIAIALSIVTIVDMTLEVPLSQALVAMKSPLEAHYETALTIGALRAVMLAVLFLLVSWPLANWYQDARLAPLIAVFGLTPAARSLVSPRTAELMRSLSFGPMFTAQVAGKLIAAAAMGAVLWANGGYWAIVANNLVAAIATTVISYFFAPMGVRFNLIHWRAFANLAGWFSLSQILAAFSWQLDRLMMGFAIRKDIIGQYAMASDVSMLPIQGVIAPAMQPVMSALSQLQDEPERRAQAFLVSTNAVMLVSVPVFAYFLLTPEWIVHILLGPNWSESGWILSGLAVTVFASAYMQVASALAVSMNRMRALFYMHACSLLALLLFLPIGLNYFGLEGVIASRALASVLTIVLLFRLVRWLTSISMLRLAMNIWKILLSGAALIGALAILRQYFLVQAWPEIVEMLTMGLLGMFVYFCTLKLLNGLPDFQALKTKNIGDQIV